MSALPASARALIESAVLAHLVTLNQDGSPQVTCVWTGLDGDEIVAAHLGSWQKVRNVRSDPRVAVSWEGEGAGDFGLRPYLVVYGSARIEVGGAPELLQRLAHVHLGPDVAFPPMPDPPPGYVTRITVDRVAGNGPWTAPPG
jgi:PPOX class probable F420-dependent enzyme